MGVYPCDPGAPCTLVPSRDTCLPSTHSGIVQGRGIQVKSNCPTIVRTPLSMPASTDRPLHFLSSLLFVSGCAVILIGHLSQNSDGQQVVIGPFFPGIYLLASLLQLLPCGVGGGTCLECVSPLPPISPVPFCFHVTYPLPATLRFPCDNGAFTAVVAVPLFQIVS